mmetsp:Transcript_44162/g.137514  ORF Transcript_44162/g.137514 Transcript_44162/m.137514 type:complete len:646 (-) Transcript_44162:394-2331(-)
MPLRLQLVSIRLFASRLRDVPAAHGSPWKLDFGLRVQPRGLQPVRLRLPGPRVYPVPAVCGSDRFGDVTVRDWKSGLFNVGLRLLAPGLDDGSAQHCPPRVFDGSFRHEPARLNACRVRLPAPRVDYVRQVRRQTRVAAFRVRRGPLRGVGVRLRLLALGIRAVGAQHSDAGVRDFNIWLQPLRLIALYFRLLELGIHIVPEGCRALGIRHFRIWCDTVRVVAVRVRLPELGLSNVPQGGDETRQHVLLLRPVPPRLGAVRLLHVRRGLLAVCPELRAARLIILDLRPVALGVDPVRPGHGASRGGDFGQELVAAWVVAVGHGLHGHRQLVLSAELRPNGEGVLCVWAFQIRLRLVRIRLPPLRIHHVDAVVRAPLLGGVDLWVDALRLVLLRSRLGRAGLVNVAEELCSIWIRLVGLWTGANGLEPLRLRLGEAGEHAVAPQLREAGVILVCLLVCPLWLIHVCPRLCQPRLAPVRQKHQGRHHKRRVRHHVCPVRLGRQRRHPHPLRGECKRTSGHGSRRHPPRRLVLGGHPHHLRPAAEAQHRAALPHRRRPGRRALERGQRSNPIHPRDVAAPRFPGWFFDGVTGNRREAEGPAHRLAPARAEARVLLSEEGARGEVPQVRLHCPGARIRLPELGQEYWAG